jgi:predicted aconitase with swiveling domain
MSEIVLIARCALGRKVSGEAMVAKDGFSARYDLNRLRGVFSRPTHKLVGQSYIGRVLVLDTAKGGVASAWMLNEMQSRDMAPLAIIFNSVNPILAQGAALGNITMLAGFDEDVTAIVPHGSWVEIDPAKKTLRVLPAERTTERASHDSSPAHEETDGPRTVRVVPKR